MWNNSGKTLQLETHGISPNTKTISPPPPPPQPPYGDKSGTPAHHKGWMVGGHETLFLWVLDTPSQTWCAV